MSVEIRFSSAFKRRLKSLSKRYRRIRQDLEPIIQEISEGKTIGNQIVGVKFTVYKVRIRNSDIPTGKSGGYRLIYQIVAPELIMLLLIYAKSDQSDVSQDEILDAINHF